MTYFTDSILEHLLSQQNVAALNKAMYRQPHDQLDSWTWHRAVQHPLRLVTALPFFSLSYDTRRLQRLVKLLHLIFIRYFNFFDLMNHIMLSQAQVQLSPTKIA